MSIALSRDFLVEALDLVASYLFSRHVELGIRAVGRLAPPEPSDETSRFLHELEARHALACGLRLREILPRIERGVSSSGSLAREESKAAIRGRLDIPHYIARRSQRKSLPRLYPLIVNREVPQTPENALVVRALAGVATQLSRYRFPRTTAEGLASLALYSWARARLRRWPWSVVKSLASIDRLGIEVSQRIHKRQTGNEPGYSSLLDWIAEWQADIERLTGRNTARIAGGLLAFPPGDFFWERVFEIWSLREVARSLQRCSSDLVEGPHPLHERDKGPIYRFRRGNSDIAVWFQRQAPMGSPRWSYQADGSPLTGVADITLTDDRYVPLLIDAKLRLMATETRSEETYKMLGYAENFRKSFGSTGFQGILVFIGTANESTSLVGPNDSRLLQIVVDSELRSRAQLGQHFDSAIRQWLDASRT